MSKKNMAAKCRQAMSLLSMLTLYSLGPVSAVGAAPSPNAPSTKLSTPILSTQTVAVELAVEMAVDGESNEVTDSHLLEEALSVAESMEDTDYKSMALAGIARSYTEKGDFGKAGDLLAQALQILAQNGEPELNRSKVFNRIAVGYFEIGEKERAIELLQQSLASIGEVRASTRNYEYLLEIIDLYAKFGDTEAAIALIAPMLPTDSSYDLVRVASVYGLLGESDEARSALDELALMAEGLPESDDRLGVVSKIAIAYAEIEEVDAARNFLNAALPDPLAIYPELDEQGYAISVLSQLADTYGRLGDIETQQAFLERTFEFYVPNNLPKPNQLAAWQALLFGRMAQNYAQLSDERAPAAHALLLQIAAENNWDSSFQMYLAILAQAESERGEGALVQQRLTTAIAMLDTYEYGVYTSTRIGRTLRMLTTMAAVYGQMPDSTLKREGLASLTQAAHSVAYSAAQQKLLGAIALAYNSTDACQLIPTGNWAEAFSPNATCQ